MTENDLDADQSTEMFITSLPALFTDYQATCKCTKRINQLTYSFFINAFGFIAVNSGWASVVSCPCLWSWRYFHITVYPLSSAPRREAFIQALHSSFITACVFPHKARFYSVIYCIVRTNYPFVLVLVGCRRWLSLFQVHPSLFPVREWKPILKMNSTLTANSLQSTDARLFIQPSFSKIQVRVLRRNCCFSL